MADPTPERPPAELVWEGDSLLVARSFPKEVRRRLGEDLERIRLGVRPKGGRSMASVGPGVAELRQRDQEGWYRTLYLSVIEGKLHVLHCFVKKSAKTGKNDLSIAATRLKAVRSRLSQEKKDAKRQ